MATIAQRTQVVEDIVAPSVRRLAREVFDCGDLQRFLTRASVVRSDDRSRTREFDALYVGTRAVLVNQTKSSPRAEDARAFAEFLQSGELSTMGSTVIASDLIHRHAAITFRTGRTERRRRLLVTTKSVQGYPVARGGWCVAHHAQPHYSPAVRIASRRQGLS